MESLLEDTMSSKVPALLLVKLDSKLLRVSRKLSMMPISSYQLSPLLLTSLLPWLVPVVSSSVLPRAPSFWTLPLSYLLDVSLWLMEPTLSV